MPTNNEQIIKEAWGTYKKECSEARQILKQTEAKAWEKFQRISKKEDPSVCRRAG